MSTATKADADTSGSAVAAGAVVAIVAGPDDLHATTVREALVRRHGIEPVMLDSGRFPATLALTTEFGANERHVLADGEGERIDLATIDSIWWRRPEAPTIASTVVERIPREFAYSEATTALYGVLRCLPCRWINDFDATASAGRKPYQLQVARRVGLAVPDTLITSDPAAARAFYERHDGRVVYKSFLATREAWAETRLLRERDLERLDAVRIAPVIFQELVDGPLELRVTVVGERVYAAAFDLQQSRSPYDVRFDLSVPCFAYALEDETRRQLLALTHELGLVYGAIDMRLDRDGRPLFLEINPAGQFLYVEELAGLPISDGLADELATARRNHGG